MQVDLQPVGGRVALGVLHQPFGASGIGVLGQAADGHFGLLTLGPGQVHQQGAGGFGQLVHMFAELTQRNRLQGHVGFGHCVDRMCEAQQAARSLQPERSFHHPQLVVQAALLEQTQDHASAFEVQHLLGALTAPKHNGTRPHFVGRCRGEGSNKLKHAMHFA